ncbi:hypothetical protein GCM10028817_47460 [Spirosoma pomorum]
MRWDVERFHETRPNPDDWSYLIKTLITGASFDTKVSIVIGEQKEQLKWENDF